MRFAISALVSLIAGAITFIITKSQSISLATLLVAFPLITLLTNLLTKKSAKPVVISKKKRKNSFDALLNVDADEQKAKAKKAAKKALVAAKKKAALTAEKFQQATESTKSDVTESASEVESQSKGFSKKAAKKARQAANKAENNVNEAKAAITENIAKTGETSKPVIDNEKEKAKPIVEKALQHAKPVVENVKEKAAKNAVSQVQRSKAEHKIESGAQKSQAAAKGQLKAAKQIVEKVVNNQQKPEIMKQVSDSAQEKLHQGRDSSSSNDGWTTKQALNQVKKQVSPQKQKEQETEEPRNERISSEMNVPVEYHAQIIGPKGATLHTIQTATLAQVQMPRRELNSSTITISGLQESVQKCKAVIDSIVKFGYSSVTHPGQIHDDLAVDPKVMGVIIGPGGSTLKQIQSKTSTRINLPKKDSSSNRCTIIGTKADVKAAKQCIKDLIADGFSPLIHVGIVKQTVEFPSDKLALLIGPRGQTIKSIQGNTKTRINTSSNVPNGVTVIGSPEGCAQAAKEIQRLLVPVQPVSTDSEDEDCEQVESAQAWSEQGAATEDSLW